MKTILSTMLLFVVVTSCTLAQKREIIEKHYSIQSFTRVEADIVGNIIYTQSNNVSVHTEGDKELVDRLLITEKNGVLKLELKRKRKIKGKKKLTVYISSPAIESINMDGVGSFNLNGVVAADNLIIDFEGVGNFEAMELQCVSIKASYEGVGNLKLGGTTDYLEITSEGVGSVNTQKLQAKNVIVRAGGVGSVKCFASDSIDLSNTGVGSITYYGKPVVKNLKNSGIGKIKGVK